MLQKTKLPHTRLFAFLLAVFVAIGALFSSVKPVHAADGTINFHAGPSIAYGDYFTSHNILIHIEDRKQIIILKDKTDIPSSKSSVLHLSCSKVLFPGL